MNRAPLFLLLAAPAAAVAGCWVPVPQASTIVFATTQAGAPFQGTFTQYEGLVCLDAADNGKNSIRVSVRTASVDTQLPELDDALRGPDFFDSTRWPNLLFQSESVRLLGPGHYQVQGKLTLRDVTREVKVPFTFMRAANGDARIAGQLSLERLDYHVGLGQWTDTRWVGNQVDVNFSVMLKPAPGK